MSTAEEARQALDARSRKEGERLLSLLGGPESADRLYQEAGRFLELFFRDGFNWAGARAWCKRLRFQVVWPLMNRLAARTDDVFDETPASRLRAFATLYLAQMRPEPIYYRRYTWPLLSSLPPELGFHCLPDLFINSWAAVDEPAASAFLDRARSGGRPRPEPSFDPAEAAGELRRRAVEFGAAGRRAELALALDQNLAGCLPNIVGALAAHSTLPLRINLLLRGLGADYAGRISALGREVAGERLAFRFYFCDQVNYARQLRLFDYTTISTMDRLMLPALLNEAGQVLYLDMDTLAVDSLDPLLELKLGQAPLAAVAEESTAAAEWAGSIGRHLEDQDERDHMRRRLLISFGPLNRSYFNAGVLVMNLELWRHEQLDRQALAAAETFQTHDQDALNLVAGRRFLELPPRWNHMTAIQRLAEPAIIHWAGEVKPWGDSYVPFQDLWRHFNAPNWVR